MAYGVNAPFGFQPWGSLAGGSFSPKTNDYLIQATADGVTTYGSSIFTGDPVFFRSALVNGGGGTIGLIADTSNGGNAGNELPVGVFAGVKYTDTKGTVQFSPYWPGGTHVKAGTPIIASVWDDPFMIWNVQVSTSTNTLGDAVVLQSWFGQNSKFNFANGGNNLVPNNPPGGNTNTGLSGIYLDGSSDGGAAVEPLKILKLTPIEGTNKPSPSLIANTVPFLNVLVVFNSHYYKSLGTFGVVPA